MSSIVLTGDTSGTITVSAPAVAGTRTLTLPAATGTMALTSDSPAALSTASGTAPSYSARAWVNFNGIGTVAIRDSGNVSSITDYALGQYGVNFTTAMPDVNYSGFVSARLTGGTAWVSANHTTAPLTTTFRLATVNQGAFYDSEYISALIFR